MPLPNFLVIGAARSGTTSLHRALAQHPQIFVSRIKEPNFFAYDGTDDERWSHQTIVRTLAEYEALFAEAGDVPAIGEASTSYLYSSFAAEQIKRTIPHARLIAILRNPADCAFSQYLAEVRLEGETRSFARWVEAAANGERPHRLDNGLYYRHLQPYVEHFGLSALSRHLYDDYQSEPLAVLARIFRHLGVDDAFRPDLTVRHNVSGIPKSHFVERLLRRRRITQGIKQKLPVWLVRSLDDIVSSVHERNRARTVMPPKVRRDLVEFYREDILGLEGLLGRDLSAWRSAP